MINEFTKYNLTPEIQARWDALAAKAFKVKLTSILLDVESQQETLIAWVDAGSRLDIEVIRAKLDSLFKRASVTGNFDMLDVDFKREWLMLIATSDFEAKDYAILSFKIDKPINEELHLLFEFARHTMFFEQLYKKELFCISTEAPGITEKLLPLPMTHLWSDAALTESLAIYKKKATLREVLGIPKPGMAEAEKEDREAAARMKASNTTVYGLSTGMKSREQFTDVYSKIKSQMRQHKKAGLS